jgi:hypothetical protein
MDPFSIAAMAASILAPYIAKGSEAFASEFGEIAGQKIGDLLDLIKNKFRGDKEAETVLDVVKNNPESAAQVDSLEKEIDKKMKEDPDFSKKLNALMQQVQETESGKTVIKAYYKSVAAENITSSTITISLLL